MDNSWKNSEHKKRMVESWPKFRKWLLGFLAFNFIILAWNVFDFIWRAGQAKDIISSLGQIFLFSGMIFSNAATRGKENPRRDNIISLVFIVPAGICMVYALWSQLFAA